MFNKKQLQNGAQLCNKRHLALAMLLLISPLSALGDEPAKRGKQEERQSVLFKRFLRSMTLTPLKRKAGAPPVVSPQTKPTSSKKMTKPGGIQRSLMSSPTSLSGKPKACTSCGSPLVKGKCSGGKGKCSGGSGGAGGAGGGMGIGSGASAGASSSTVGSLGSPGSMGAAGATGMQGGGRGQAPPSGNSNSGNSNKGNQNSGSQTNGSSGTGLAKQGANSGAANSSGSQSGSNPAFGAPSSGTGSSGAPPSGATASSAIPGANQTGMPANGVTTPPTSGTSANSGSAGTVQSSGSGGYVALGWEVVQPAGTGAADWATAISIPGSRTNDQAGDGEARRLDSGTLKSSLQTGPNNLLMLPPDVASVVYVLDCSSSMIGGRFARVQSAIIDAVEQMQPSQQFALLLFNDNALQIRGGGYRAAGPTGAQVLLQELSMILPNGGTNPADALLLAIQLKPEAVVILSDGEFDSSTVDRVTRLNRTAGKNTQINCVAVGARVQTLQRLAALNGPGNYVEVP